MNKKINQSYYDQSRHSATESLSDTYGVSNEARSTQRRLIKASFRLREQRRNLVQSEKIDDTAWWMLLDLYLAHIDKNRLYVSAICANAGTSATTALRRLEDLIDTGLVTRLPDTRDSRRIFVILTAGGLEAAHSYLALMNNEFFAALAPEMSVRLHGQDPKESTSQNSTNSALSIGPPRSA